MAFFTRPDLDDRQFKQATGSTLHLSGSTDFVGELKSKGIEIDASTGGTGGAVGTVLTYDGTKIILAPSTGGTGIYDGESPSNITVGGIPAGTSLTGRTFTDLFEQLLITYLAPAFTSFSITGQATLIEVGTALSGNKTFTWATSNSSNVQPNSITIRDVTASVNLATGLANDGTQLVNIGTITNTSPITQSWRAEAFNTNASPFISSNFTVSSIYPYFYGKVTSGSRPVATASLVTGGTKVLASSTGTIIVNFNSTASDYLWFAIPSISTSKTVWFVNALNTGAIGGVVSPGGNLFPAFDTVSVTTVLWAGISYKVYISNYSTAQTLPMELRNS